MSDPRAQLQRTLGHGFADPALLDEALTHRSASGRNNERLEFLGDALLNAVIGEALYRRLPRANEGDLSRLRALLVKEDTLAEVAREFALGEHLRLGAGELKSGGHRRASILADALEALFGAIYLDSDFATCRAVILALFDARLRCLPEPAELKDPKTRLQEFRQARGESLPVYHVLSTAGEAHAQSFTVACELDDRRSVAVGTSRRKAEQEAARRLLEELESP